MTRDELHTALEGGKTLAEIAKSKNVTVASLVKAMVAAAEDDLATAVKDGRRAQADTMTASLKVRITDMVNGVRHQHGFRGGRPADVPADVPAPSSSGLA